MYFSLEFIIFDNNIITISFTKSEFVSLARSLRTCMKNQIAIDLFVAILLLSKKVLPQFLCIHTHCKGWYRGGW